MTATAERVILDPISQPDATNLVVNPSFEVDATLWTAFGTSTISRVTNWSSVGGASLRVVITGQTGVHGANTQILAASLMPVTVGETYTSQAVVNVIDDSPSGVTAYFQWWDAGFGFLSFSAGGTPQTGTGIKNVTETRTAVANAAYVALLIAADGSPAYNAEFKVDAAMVEHGSTASAYFDGDTASTSPMTTYAWTGTPHASSSTVTSTRTSLDITCWIDHEGVDWGEAAIDAVMAQRNRGEVPVDFTVPNREASIPLNFVEMIGGTTPVTARANIQAKVGLFQREGGVIQRVTNSGGTVYADVVNASMSASSVSGLESSKDWDLEASATLELLPEFYEAEQALSDHTETTAAELVFTETGIDGDYPARVRIVVDDDQGVDQRGLLFGFRNRHYSSASTAATRYEAEALTALDTATKPALSGASGGTVIRHGTISTNWTPVMNTNLAAGSYLTHTGTYRLWGRCYSTSGTTVQSRAVWDVGDLVNPVENDPIQMPGASNFFMQDYGEVRLDPSPVGTHRWQGQIQAKGAVGSENFSVDKLWLIGVDEGYGKLSAPINVREGLSTYNARSGFTNEAGAISGDSADVGGAWATSGDATDLSAAAGVVTRTTTGDATFGRFAASGVAALATQVSQVSFMWSAVPAANGTLRSAAVTRFADTDNFAIGVVDFIYLGGATQAKLQALYRDGGGAITSLGNNVNIPTPQLNTLYWVRMYADAFGGWQVDYGLQGGGGVLASIRGWNSVLATGGGLATGKPGFNDYNGTATASTRTYDNFLGWVPTPDAVAFASQSIQLTTDGIVREDSGGLGYGPVSIRTGDNPRLPVAGLEGRTTEVFLKSSRGDLDQLADSHTAAQYGDDISARVFYRPSWLHVPDN